MHGHHGGIVAALQPESILQKQSPPTNGSMT
jgi:hypothetical protein